MTTLTIHLSNSEQDLAIRTILDALHVPYEEAETGMDETEYLNSSPANAAHLNKSIEQGKHGQVTQISLDDIC